MTEPTHPDSIVIGMYGEYHVYVLAPPTGEILIPLDRWNRIAAVVRATVAYGNDTEDWEHVEDMVRNLTPDDIEAVSE